VSPLSRDPDARERQLANLRPGAVTAPAGNTRAVSHGGYARIAQERLDAKAREIFDALASDAPVRVNDQLPAHDAAAFTLLTDLLCRLDTLRADIALQGMLVERGKRKGQVRPAVELEAKLRRDAADLLDRLGMTPASRARLGVDVKRAESIADELEAARKAREAREARDGEATVVDATVIEESI
jgi:phage terminase small subunit